jgi:hypothetical protein
MSKKLSCIITSATINISESYYNSKVDKIGSEELLHSTYICKSAKKLLKLGNSVKKVRELLDSTCNSPIDDQFISDLIFRSKKRITDTSADFNTLSSITHNETDSDVKVFIKKLNI